MTTLLLTLFLSGPFAGTSWAPQDTARYPDPPVQGQYIVDEANLLTAGDTAMIRLTCDELLEETGIPIYVVTISSLAERTAYFWTIEKYARLLFNEWGIGAKEWNRGILLLVSVGDRKARIELGAEWGRSKDDVCREIMDDWIVANFKKGEFSTGIRLGVERLGDMARDVELPSPPVSHGVLLAWGVGIGLTIFTVISLFRRGSSGWAWIFWGVVFTVIGAILMFVFSSRGSRYGGSGWGGGGFSGGSFGGGFSGGGGATGSW